MNLKTTSKMGVIAALAAALGVFMIAGCDSLMDALDTDPSGPVGGDAVKIGLIQPSGYFPSFSLGAELALAHVNANGGIHGVQAEFVKRDNQGGDPYPTAASTIGAAQDLIQNEGVAAIVGPFFSTSSIALGQALNQAGATTPFIPAATSPVVTQSYSHAALISANLPLQSTILSDFARKELKAETASILALEGDAYSEQLTASFTQLFEAAGGSVVSAETYVVETVDFSAHAAALAAGGSDVCFLICFPPEVSLIIDQARAAGYEGVFIGPNGWDNPAELFSVLDDNSVLDGSYFTIDFLPSATPEAQQFAAAYEAAYGMPADSFAGNGFDAMMILAEAIENAGVNATPLPENGGGDDDTVGASNPLDGDAILEALVKIGDYRGATVISHFDENRLAVKDLVIMKIQDGASMFHALWENPLKGADPGGPIDNPNTGNGGGDNPGNGGGNTANPDPGNGAGDDDTQPDNPGE